MLCLRSGVVILNTLIVLDIIIILIIIVIVNADVLCSYPTDAKTYGIDEQFLWGYSLLISPVLHEVFVQKFTTFDVSIITTGNGL